MGESVGWVKWTENQEFRSTCQERMEKDVLRDRGQQGQIDDTDRKTQWMGLENRKVSQRGKC